MMNVHALTPILNVSDLAQSFAWFEKLGWTKAWEWGSPPTFAAVQCGKVELFLALGEQGGRGKGASARTFGPDGDPASDKGVWMSLWVRDVDAIGRHCLANGIEVVFGPQDMPWSVRELHIRHPDGHVFRVSQGLGKVDQ